MFSHQVATAVNGATEDSLVIVDEFGKGTATVLSNSVISNLTLLFSLRILAIPSAMHVFLVFPCLDRWLVLTDCHTPSLA